MPTYQEDYNKVNSLRQQQANLNKEAGDITVASKTFGDEVMGAVRQARASRGVSMLNQGVGDTTAQLVSDPANMRARMTNVNPLEVDALTASARAQNLRTLATLGDFEEGVTGTINEAINAGTNQLVAKAAAKKAEADAAKDEADQLIEMIKLKMDEEKMRFDMASKGSKKNPMDVLAMLLGQGGMSTADQPQFTPSRDGVVSGNYISQGGQWIPLNKQGGQSGLKMTQDQLLMAMASDPENATFYEKFYNASNPKQTSREQFDQGLKQALDSMKSLYFYAPNKSLSVGKTNTGVGGNLSKLSQWIKGGTDQKFADSLTSYKQQKDLAIGLINQARMAGVLNAGEYEQLQNSMPNEFTSEKVARDWFDNTLKTLGSSGGNMRVQDPKTGNVYETESMEEYKKVIRQGYIPY